MAGPQRCTPVNAPDGADGAGVLGHRRRQAGHPAPRTRAAIQNPPSAPARAQPNARRPPRAPPREIKQAGRAKPRAHLGLRETRGGSGIRESVRSGTCSYGLTRACSASRAMPLSGSNHGLVRGIDGSISQHHTACDLDLFGFLAAPTVGAAPCWVQSEPDCRPAAAGQRGRSVPGRRPLARRWGRRRRPAAPAVVWAGHPGGASRSGRWFTRQRSRRRLGRDDNTGGPNRPPRSSRRFEGPVRSRSILLAGRSPRVWRCQLWFRDARLGVAAHYPACPAEAHQLLQ